jgi:hypothetical protein
MRSQVPEAGQSDHADYHLQQKQAPSLDFTHSPADPRRGSTVALNAVVSAEKGRPVPTGSVSFFYGYKLIANEKLHDGVVSLSAKVPKAQEHSLLAVYLGDSNYRPRSSAER